VIPIYKYEKKKIQRQSRTRITLNRLTILGSPLLPSKRRKKRRKITISVGIFFRVI
jgi:hypothetical protein